MGYTKKIKLLALDLDGTLFYPKNYFTLITNKNVKMIRDFVNQGGHICVVTGRTLKIKKQIEKRLGCKISFIGCNGSFFATEDDIVTNKVPLDNKKMLELVSTVDHNYGIRGWLLMGLQDKMYAYTNENFVVKSLIKFATFFRFAYSDKIVISKKKFFEVLENEEVYKLMPVFGLGKKHNDDAYEVFKEFRDKFSEFCTLAHSVSSIEITGVNTSKGKCLLDLAQRNNLNINEIAVVGDSGNDISMFDNFPISFCMDHSVQGVKKHAKFVIKRVSDLENYLQEENEDKLFN